MKRSYVFLHGILLLFASGQVKSDMNQDNEDHGHFGWRPLELIYSSRFIFTLKIVLMTKSVVQHFKALSKWIHFRLKLVNTKLRLNIHRETCYRWRDNIEREIFWIRIDVYFADILLFKFTLWSALWFLIVFLKVSNLYSMVIWDAVAVMRKIIQHPFPLIPKIHA